MAKNTISMSELRARCTQVIAEVARGSGPVTVTRRGRPVARIVPVEAPRPKLFGCLAGIITIHGDIVEPVDVSPESGR
jgi:prevent-host-death family protein